MTDFKCRSKIRWHVKGAWRRTVTSGSVKVLCILILVLIVQFNLVQKKKKNGSFFLNRKWWCLVDIFIPLSHSITCSGQFLFPHKWEPLPLGYHWDAALEIPSYFVTNLKPVLFPPPLPVQLTAGPKSSALATRRPTGSTSTVTRSQWTCCARDLLTYHKCTRRMLRCDRWAAVSPFSSFHSWR